MNPLISIIIPTYNRSELLERAIKSVLEQTYTNYELIIIDDGSEENLVTPQANIVTPQANIVTPQADIVTPQANIVIPAKAGIHLNTNIHFHKQKNQGPAAARNTGIKEAKGDYIAFLDSDDLWHKDKLKIQIQAMQENPEYIISHTHEKWFRRGEYLNQKKKHARYNGYIFDKCLPLCVVGPSTVMLKKELFDKVGLFDESFQCCEDYELWLRVASKYKFLLIDEPLTIKHGGREDQVSYIHRTGMDEYRIRALEKILKPEFKLEKNQREQVIKELKKKCLIYGNGCIKHGKKEKGQKILNIPSKYITPQG